MRVINVAAAQMGPIQKADSRGAVVKRMIALMDEAKARSVDLIVYPELALTTFFRRWYMEDQAEVDAWGANSWSVRFLAPLQRRPFRPGQHIASITRASMPQSSIVRSK
jgi:predicted amidohydrolase